jgi:polar amino acid transport system permease protein
VAEIKSPSRELRPGRSARIEVTDGALIPGRGEKSAFSAWRISFFGALAVLVILFIVKPHPYRDIMLFVPDGILKTFEVTLMSIACALVVGLLTGIGRISKVPIINRIATIYVEIIRGIPLLVQIFYIYYALGKLIQVPDIFAAVIAMTVCYGAYLGEIFRAGIQSIHKGQMEAAIALGLTRGQALRRIILPQTFRVVLPPLGNEFIALLKDSSLVSILAVSDLLRRGREYASKTFDYFEAFTVVALVYLVMTLFFSRLVAMMEERMNRRG